MIKIKPYIFFVITFFFIVGCKNEPNKAGDTVQVNNKVYSEEELYRPNFHFTPKVNWMNDPNGMFFHNGYYHLYFQHYPEENVWGPMHWGHAISTDMVNWKEQPIAIYPDEKGYIFSGSAVVDLNNTSGFGKNGKPPVIAMFTYHDMKGEKSGELKYQSQAIAYSLDEGQTFTKFSGNPVIENPGIKDFRDPKIVWDSIHEKWIMVLAAGQKIMFYSSKNLKDWELESDFGEGIGGHGGVWECPDFFPMVVQGSDEIKWVLLVSINPGGPNGGSATQYFIGDFNGKQFTINSSFEKDLNDSEHKSIWIDYGKDNYAGVTWANIPATDGRKLFVGWMSNWQYAQKVPTEGWRSSMTTARELTIIKNNNNQYRLKSYPVNELNDYVAKTIEKDDFNLNEEVLIARDPLVDFTRAEVEFTIENLQGDTYTFILHNDKGEAVYLGLNNSEKFFFIDRSKSGNTLFHEEFASKPSIAPAENVTNSLEVKLLIDKSSIEVFYNNGEIVMTELFFSTAPMTKFSIKPNKDKIYIKNLKVKQLKLN